MITVLKFCNTSVLDYNRGVEYRCVASGVP